MKSEMKESQGVAVGTRSDWANAIQSPLPEKEPNDLSTPFLLPPFSGAISPWFAVVGTSTTICQLASRLAFGGRDRRHIWEATASLIYERVPFFAPPLLGEWATLIRIR